MAGRSIECAEFTICYTDVSIVKDDVINESDGVTEEITP
jgi:hypothetical protein